MKKQPKNKKSKSVWKGFRDSPWYVKVGIITTLLLVSFFVFKTCLNTYNVSVLDKAEVKMRQLNTPKADHTLYERSCSPPNRKFGSLGFDYGQSTCRVVRADIFFNKTPEQAAAVAGEYSSRIRAQHEDARASFKDSHDFLNKFKSYSDGPLVDGVGLHAKLHCYVMFTPKTGLEVNSLLHRQAVSKDSSNMLVATSCYKKFLTQIYPER